MKKLALIAALATMFASQAFAQSYDPDLGTGNVLNMPAAEGQFDVGRSANATDSYGTSPYAYAPRHVRHVHASPTTQTR